MITRIDSRIKNASFLFFASVFMLGNSFASDLVVREAWIPQAPPNAAVHAAYISFQNTGDTPRYLISVSSEVFDTVHIHESKQSLSGVASMMMVHQIEIPKDGILEMMPGGLHVMLLNPKMPISKNATIPLKLGFQDGEVLEIQAIIKARHAGS